MGAEGHRATAGGGPQGAELQPGGGREAQSFSRGGTERCRATAGGTEGRRATAPSPKKSPNDYVALMIMFLDLLTLLFSVLEFVCLPWSEVCSARVTSLLLLLLLILIR